MNKGVGMKNYNHIRNTKIPVLPLDAPWDRCFNPWYWGPEKYIGLAATSYTGCSEDWVLDKISCSTPWNLQYIGQLPKKSGMMN